MSLEQLKWDPSGLVTVVVQDRHHGDVRMVAHANREALEKTIETGDAYFYSRSRASLWRKGETSGNTIRVAEVYVDCDGDAVLYLVDPAGPSCHTGARTCFYRRLDGEADRVGLPTLARLDEELRARVEASSTKSYTRSLLEKGAETIGAKIREEADELARAISGETDDRVAAEAADLVYHALVGLLSRKLSIRDVEEVLAERFGISGHTEKASRTKG